MKHSLLFSIAALLLLALVRNTKAQGIDTIVRNRALDSLIQWHAVDTLRAERISYSDFMGSVLAHNLNYAVQKYNVSIAQAQIEIARIYPDPAISSAFSKDITGGIPSDSLGGNILSIGASQTILLGGKISKAVAVAEENRYAAEATVQDFFWTLRASATQAYIEAAIADSNHAEALRMYQNLANLAQINAQRVSAGDIARTDFIQSRVDAMEARAAVLQADAARRTAFLALGQFMGERDAFYRPASTIVVPNRSFNVEELIARADTERFDILAARDELESARLGIDLARALRWPDLTVGLGYTTTASTAGLPAPFPNQNVLGINVSIPIPISSALNHGTMDQAEFNFEQSRDSLAALQLAVETSVRQANAQYRLAREQYEIYSTALLRDAETVWQARLYSYKAGNAQLLDVLTAENTLVTVYQSYYSALQNYANALVTLEASAQVWDIAF